MHSKLYIYHYFYSTTRQDEKQSLFSECTTCHIKSSLLHLRRQIPEESNWHLPCSQSLHNVIRLLWWQDYKGKTITASLGRSWTWLHLFTIPPKSPKRRHSVNLKFAKIRGSLLPTGMFRQLKYVLQVLYPRSHEVTKAVAKKALKKIVRLLVQPPLQLV